MKITVLSLNKEHQVVEQRYLNKLYAIDLGQINTNNTDRVVGCRKFVVLETIDDSQIRIKTI